MRIYKQTWGSNRRAFTLVELVLCIGLMTLISAATIGLIRQSSDDFLWGSRRSHLLQEGRAALSKMVRTLRQAQSLSGVSGPSDASGSITFQDNDGVERQFQLNGDSEELNYGPTGGLTALTNAVTSLTFACYDVEGVALTAPVNVADVHSMRIDATLTDTTESSISFDLSTRVYWPLSVGAGSGGTVAFVEFTEAQAGSNVTSITLNTPAGTSEGDLLIAAVVADGSETLAPPVGQGWTEIDQGIGSSQVTLGVWWKLAGASESATHQFTWSSSEQCYAWMMCFTGHDPDNPINNASAQGGGNTSSPDGPSVTSTVANCMILRIGGFDDDDITVDDTGLSSHTTITMDKSSAGPSHTCSGGAGYEQQVAIGASGIAEFSLTDAEQYYAVTVAIAPDS